jgi:metal-responsive CopG/Arc/MetJ family transcriptional regulator
MREILSVSISSAMKNKLNSISRKYKLSKSEIVKTAVDKYLAVTEFQELRKRMMPYSEKAGYLTDEDIFNDKSL